MESYEPSSVGEAVKYRFTRGPVLIAMGVSVGFFVLYYFIMHTWWALTPLVGLVIVIVLWGNVIIREDLPALRRKADLARQAVYDELVQSEARDAERRFLQRARDTVFELHETPKLTSSDDDTVTLAIWPAVMGRDKPVEVSITQRNLWRANSLAPSFGVSFPEAMVDANGNITTYGETAIMYGPDFEQLKEWVDPVILEENEAMMGWQIANDHKY